MNINTSLHSHTTFCDGKNTAEEMILGAIECGCHTLGFSGHSPLYINGEYQDWAMSIEGEKEYRKEVRALAEKYKGQIDVLLGIELDYYSDTPDPEYDYIIGSVHYVKKGDEAIAVDIFPDSVKEFVGRVYGGDYMAYARDYYETVADVINKTHCDIVGHFDLITKFNEKRGYIDTTDPKYRTYAFEALDALIAQDALFEVNSGAISRGWRSTPYPESQIMKRIGEKNGRVIITADTHNAETIMNKYDLSLEMLRENGVKNIYTVKDKKIVLA